MLGEADIDGVVIPMIGGIIPYPPVPRCTGPAGLVGVRPDRARVNVSVDNGGGCRSVFGGVTRGGCGASGQGEDCKGVFQKQISPVAWSRVTTRNSDEVAVHRHIV